MLQQYCLRTVGGIIHRCHMHMLTLTHDVMWWTQKQKCRSGQGIAHLHCSFTICNDIAFIYILHLYNYICWFWLTPCFSSVFTWRVEDKNTWVKERSRLQFLVCFGILCLYILVADHQEIINVINIMCRSDVIIMMAVRCTPRKGTLTLKIQ